jgi:hypothetical protein
MVADELNMKEEAIPITEVEYKSKVRPAQTHGRAEAKEPHIIPELRPDLARLSQFSLLHFSIS